ncbi:hypothetical protein B0T16DRAFT_324578 [Cercophora newfieldiana]|uniref:Uncharacterized protein n=1 Tax=Cercophora newfieldiana TaxID=92897 RepID=A0AA40CU64_9PEZI|nr:hypothetical protein B0T16DRAFT_324578 [Cercophora newfieldiana]
MGENDGDCDGPVGYQVRQLPSEPIFSSEEWKRIFHPFPLVKPTVKKHDIAPGAIDLTWEIDSDIRLRRAYFKYDEFGYDEEGYVCKLGPGPRLEASGTDASGDTPSRSNNAAPACEKVRERTVGAHVLVGLDPGEQRYGREWQSRRKFGLSGDKDDTLFSIAALQLCRDADLVEGAPLGPSRKRLVECFLAQFRGTWNLSQKLWGSSDHLWAGSASFKKSKWEDLVFQYHMRVFTAPTDTGPSFWKPPGPGLTRVSGPLKCEKHGRSLRIYEARYSVGLKTTWRLDSPVFSLVTMADSVTPIHLQDLAQLGNWSDWEAAGLHPSTRATGMAAFAFRIQSLLPHWETQWSNLIDHIGKLLNNDILRTAAEWIRESMDDLRRTAEDIERLYLLQNPDGSATFLPAMSDSDVRDATNVFKSNWKSVTSHHKRLGDALLTRIEMRKEEAKSLRDGLFSATSVSEAAKSTQLNNYILVFTIVTIFYLPLSFMTDQKQVAWSIVTVILVAGVTYLLSGISMWVVGSPDGKRGFTGDDAKFGHRSLLDQIKGAFPREQRKGETDMER